MGLNYDDTAWNFFALTFLTMYALPATYFFLKHVQRCLLASGAGSHGASKPRTAQESEKLQKIATKKKADNSLMDRGFLIQGAILACVWSLILLLFNLLQAHDEIASFNPFKLLGIEEGESMKNIKKAYRNKSLQYHPDKCVEEKSVCEAQFSLIAKAHEALTDDAARENWEKYGNPDGRQALQVSIGLPTILLDPSVHGVVLITYLLVLVVVIPATVWYWYSNSKKYGEKMIMHDTYGVFNFTLNEHTPVKSLPEILAAAAEFRENPKLPFRMPDHSFVDSSMKELHDRHGMPKVGSAMKAKRAHPKVQKGCVVLHHHSLRKSLPATLRGDVDTMLGMSPPLIDAMMNVSASRRWLQTTINICKFSQYLTQAIWVKDSPLLQLPHINETDLKMCKGAKITTLAQFMGAMKTYAADANATKGDDDRVLKTVTKLLNGKSDQERSDILRMATVLPDLQISGSIYTAEEDVVAESDIVTLQLTFVRKHLVAEQREFEVTYGDDEEVGVYVSKEKGDDFATVDIVSPSSLASEGGGLYGNQKIEELDELIAINGKAVDKDIDDKKAIFNMLDSEEADRPLTLKFRREKGEAALPVYAPHFPVEKKETWLMVITFTPPKGSNEMLVVHKIIDNQDRNFTEKIMMPGPSKAGKIVFKVQVLSMDFIGVDVSTTLTLDVKSKSEVAAPKIHEDDAQLDSEVDPSLSQLLFGDADPESDSEDEFGDDDDDDEADNKKDQ